MKLPVLRRKFKNLLQGRAQKRVGAIAKQSLPLSVISAATLVVVLLIFCVVQLLVVSVLSPKGKDLKRLNAEKDVLLEENRKLEHDIAELGSLAVVKARSESELGMERAQNVIYLEVPESRADLSSQAEDE